MVFASIVEYAAVSYIGHIRPAGTSPSSTKLNGTCSRLPSTAATTVLDGGPVAPADDQPQAVVVVNRDASERHLTSRRHLSIPNTSSRNLASSLHLALLLRASRTVDKPLQR